MGISKLGFVFIAMSLLILAAGCKNAKSSEITGMGVLQFKSEAYGFSFSYPDKWEEVSRDLPDKWALLDKNRNTILFLVNKAQKNDLLALGRLQALRDVYNEDKIPDLSEAELQKTFEIVKLEYFNNREWYTYGIKFSDKDVNSLVSGTLCQGNEIVFVLVSDYLSFDKNKATYTNMISTFEC